MCFGFLSFSTYREINEAAAARRKLQEKFYEKNGEGLYALAESAHEKELLDRLFQDQLKAPNQSQD